MNRYDGSGYTGAGYHDSSQDDLVILPVTKKTEDTNIIALRQVQLSSPHEFVSTDLLKVVERWNQFDSILIKSWDLIDTYGVHGSIARLENSLTKIRTNDFEFTIQRRGFDKLKPNMNRLREEVDAGLITLNWSEVGDITRYTGVTAAGDFQIILAVMPGDYFGWVGFGDQRFIALTNNWELSKSKTNTSLDIRQSTEIVHDITSAIAYQRSIL